jgi:hypothetical protein
VRRWSCPNCNRGALAPDRLDGDDARGYCLRCTAKTGRLVRRVCPAKERTVAARASARQTRAARRREKLKAQREAHRTRLAALRALPIAKLTTLNDSDALLEAKRRYAKLAAWERDLTDVTITIRHSAQAIQTSGRAWLDRIVVTVGSDVADAHATILHELAHVAAGQDEWHGARWRGFFLAAASEVCGRRVEASSVLTRRELQNVIAAALAASWVQS